MGGEGWRGMEMGEGGVGGEGGEEWRCVMRVGSGGRGM